MTRDSNPNFAHGFKISLAAQVSGNHISLRIHPDVRDAHRSVGELAINVGE
jgi:hypothetical protein